jgi:hypothetical protein
MTPPDPVIAAFRKHDPAALALAEVVSFAVRVEPYLLRRMRLELLPELDAGAEADVWLSPLMQVRSPEGAVFYPEIAAALRTQLAEQKSVTYFEAWNLLQQLHQHLPATIQLEEQIAFLSSSPHPDAMEEVKVLLQRAAKTLVTAEREGIANWAARALPRFPKKVRDLEGAKILVSASYLRLTQHLPLGELNQGMPSWMSWILPAELEKKPTHVRVRLLPKGIELTLGEAGTNKIEVPEIKPCLVEITWKTEDGRKETEQVPLQRGEPRLVEAPSRSFDIRTVQGKRYRVEKRPMAEPKNRTCFVIMGFGQKTDYPTGRVVDLDKSYRLIIKPAAKQAGYECIRPDEIQHAGSIDVPLYQHLLSADVVIADVSTYNVNAFYELGVRHALRPYATIVIAEDKLVFPFDVGQIAIRKYQHLGAGIDADEAERMRSELAAALVGLSGTTSIDSPVYTFLSDLEPPRRVGVEREVAFPSAPVSEAQTSDEPTLRVLMDQVDAALNRSDFVDAKSLLAVVRNMRPNDIYVVQKLALATYKSKKPDPVAALKEAEQLLETLNPQTSIDTETLRLYAAVQKRLWEETRDSSYIDRAIWASEKGFYVKDDYYNGINLAYLLNVRGTQDHDPRSAEPIADYVQAQRIRRKVIEICEAALKAAKSPEDEFWIRASMAEAWTGLGDRARSRETLNTTRKNAPAQWMVDSTVEQLSKLEKLIADSPLRRLGLSERVSDPQTL